MQTLNFQESKQYLFTQFDIESKPTIDYNNALFFCGSCFSENIGNKFQKLQFDTLMNPAGILFDPLSISNLIDRIAGEKTYSTQDLFCFSDKFYSLDHHGTFRSQSEKELLDKINSKLKESLTFIYSANVAIITLGTAYAYYHKSSSKYVGNCHKLPNNQFNKVLLTDLEIRNAIKNIIVNLKILNPEIRIIFTISPVKHLKDGIAENALSKARLLSALHGIIDENSFEKTDYFPAFEIVCEELRDHRFYKDDLAHPNDWTIQYIFQRFVDYAFTNTAQDYIKEMTAILKMKQHNLMNTDPDAITDWNQKIKVETDRVMSKYPTKQVQ